ncbi:MAG: heme-binding protein [Gemmatimonadaceae bacterium]|nr:heme-binding protein [Gloeobacterales cyanobacterium ES-bin-141]
MKRSIPWMALALLLLAANGAGAAEVGDPNAAIVEQPDLTLAGAKKVIAAAVAEAKRKGAPGAVIAVVDAGSNLIAVERLDGTFSAGADISIGKARTAVRFKKPTRFFEEVIKNGRTAMVAVPDFTPLQGGIPILHAGKVVGGIGVSGAASAQQDEEIALAGAAAMAAPSAAAPGVSYFDSPSVVAAFNRGAVLVDGSDGRNYMVHTSRRDGAGKAEVHTLDTDIIYVVDGSATFVTGGKVMEPTPIAPDEISGRAIEGGATRQIAKGDVLVVPNGTPHWFQQIQPPFTYFVVKSRESPVPIQGESQ